MKPARIFVEGKADERFLSQYLPHCFPGTTAADFSIQNTGGKDKLLPVAQKLQLLERRFEITSDAGGVNLVIFDADHDAPARRAELRVVGERLGLHFEVFLLPGNDQPGTLETLLCQCIPAENQPILDCFDSFKECVRGHGRPDRPFYLPLDKSKVYAYLEALIPHGKRELMQDAKRDYRDPAIWDLNAAALQPLRAFLTRHLTA